MATLKNTTVDDTGFLRLPVGTTAQRPASPVTGQIRYNTSIAGIEFYNGTSWTPISIFSATGGSEATIGGYKIHTFTSPGNFTVTSGTKVGELLLVGGGGSGGSGTGAGGGAGGVIYNASYSLSSGTSSVTIGAGGPFRPGGVTQGISGQNTIFGPQVASGGGYGGNTGPGIMNPGVPGGSGGGHAGYPGSPQGFPGTRAVGVPGQGNPGGLTSGFGGGGGGGYGGSGSDGNAAAGGSGGSFSTSGSSQNYAGGGSGCADGPGPASSFGGGRGFAPGGPQNNATYYGGGGGGSWDYGNAGAGAGFQGIAIVRYLA